ncbi:CidA/LrgA family protein [Prevotella fusca]|uniref:LrgA n=1 Tax=Prevotella fusca JCM 17724 TaxID=1236517 RepID=A0A0K1NID2_9BACT|nr:CidA/LrgA family protein [Prevotella fusca]AKU68446.1 LrgA [Prevotella fusca JCM 17724]QUB87395.1 CidA/LrgA family protein [Prevotella fusca JCM 17724]
MARQFFVIFGCLALGEFVVWATGIKLPSSIIGMLLLTLFLKLGWVKLKWVERLSELLIANLGFFFVPPGVALILYLDDIKENWFPIVTATVVSTLLVLVVTGHMHQLVIKFERRLMAMDLLHHRAHAEKLKKALQEMEEAEALKDAEQAEVEKALHGQSEINKTEEE